MVESKGKMTLFDLGEKRVPTERKSTSDLMPGVYQFENKDGSFVEGFDPKSGKMVRLEKKLDRAGINLFIGMGYKLRRVSREEVGIDKSQPNGDKL